MSNSDQATNTTRETTVVTSGGGGGASWLLVGILLVVVGGIYAFSNGMIGGGEGGTIDVDVELPVVSE